MKQKKVSRENTQLESFSIPKIKSIHYSHTNTLFKALAKRLNKSISLSESTIMIHSDNYQTGSLRSKHSFDVLKQISQHTSIKNLKRITNLNLNLASLDKLSAQQRRLLRRMIQKSFRSLTQISLAFERSWNIGTRAMRIPPHFFRMMSTLSSSCRNLKHISIDDNDRISKKQFTIISSLLARKLKSLKTLKLDLEFCSDIQYPRPRLFTNRLTSHLQRLNNLSLVLPKYSEKDLNTMPISKSYLQKIQYFKIKFSFKMPSAYPEHLEKSQPKYQFKNRLALYFKCPEDIKHMHKFDWLRNNFLAYTYKLRAFVLQFQSIYTPISTKEEVLFFNLDSLEQLEELSLTFDYADNLMINVFNGLKLRSDHKLQKFYLKICSFESWRIDGHNGDFDGDDGNEEHQETDFGAAFRGFCTNTLLKLKNLVDLQVEVLDGHITSRFIEILTTCAMSLPKLKKYSLNLVRLQRFSDTGLEKLQEMLTQSQAESLQDLAIGLSFCKNVTEKEVERFREALTIRFFDSNSVRVIFEDDKTDSSWRLEDEEDERFFSEEEDKDISSEDEDDNDLEEFDYSGAENKT